MFEIVTEVIDPFVFEKTADDRADANVFRQTRYARAQCTGTPDDQIDFHPRRGCQIKRTDDGFVDEGIHLGDDSCRSALSGDSDFIENGTYQMTVQGKGCQPEIIQFFGACQAGQVQKHFVDFAGDLRMCRQQTEVGIKLCRRRVIIACAEMTIIAVSTLFTADDQRKFGMGFQSHHTIDDLCTGLFELLCPVDILFFIETRFQLDDHDDFFSLAGRGNQCLHQFGCHADAIDRLFDDHDIRIVGGIADEVDDGFECLEWMVQQDILFFQGIEEVAVIFCIWIDRSLIGTEIKGRRFDEIEDFGKPYHIDWAIDAVKVIFIQTEFIEQESGEIVRAILGDFQSDRSAEVTVLQTDFQCLPEIFDFFFVNPKIAVSCYPEL